MVTRVDLLSLTAVELQSLLSRHVISSMDITARYLDQIERHNHAGLKLNAVISTASREKVLKYAKQLDDERAQGHVRGPFHGVPIILKDTYSTPGLDLPTTCGSLALSRAKAKANANVVDRLLAAGVIVIAKANMSEWGNMKGDSLMAGWSAFGGQVSHPSNEWYSMRPVLMRADANALGERGCDCKCHLGDALWPAGSSSGPAAGVAAGFAPLSLGTETDGSISMPAGRAGLYAMKITRGTVDDTGVQPAVRAFDCLGGFTRSVADLAHLVAIMQGRNPETYLLLTGTWQGLKIGFVDPSKWRSCPSALEPTEGFWQQMDDAMFAAQEKIRALGGRVVTSVPLMSYDDITAAMPDMENMEDLYPYQGRTALNSWLRSFDGAPQSIEELIAFNNAHAAEEFNTRNDNQRMLEAFRDCKTTEEEFQRNLKALRDTASGNVRSLLVEHDIDVILGPCDSRTGSVNSAAGCPVANLPLGFAHFNGRAFGLHMIAEAHQEAKMLQIMAAWEATFPENVRPPPLLVPS